MSRPGPVTTLRVSRYSISAHAKFPNTSLRPDRPMIIYHSCFPPSSRASEIESQLTSVGVVKPAWRYPMYKHHHYHSTTHEVLVVYAGAATLCFGGGQNPERIVCGVDKGDVIILPAGVAHAMLEDKGGFMMIGSYPVGSGDWDMCQGGEGDEVHERIRRLGWFQRDPIYGDAGPVTKVTRNG